MNLFVSTSEREVIAAVKYLPAVSVIIPFTPLTTIKKNLEYRLKTVLSKVEDMLTVKYTAEKAIPVIMKLKNLFRGLNYNTPGKSIVIFASPVIESVYYFNMEMEEKIVIDPSFKISDLVFCKKEKKEYLVLLLTDTFSKMYLCNDEKMKLIKSNKIADLQDSKSKINDGDTLTAQKESATLRFLYQMDQGLSIILNSYPLPVFVLGCENLLTDFKNITKNEEGIAQYIYGSYDKADGEGLNQVTEYIVSVWEEFRQNHLLRRAENAKARNKLYTGIRETLNAARKNKGRLLLIEKKLVDHSRMSKTYEAFVNMDSSCNEIFFIKDEVDEIIKVVFEMGGDVELMDNDLLKNYSQIALVGDR